MRSVLLFICFTFINTVVNGQIVSKLEGKYEYVIKHEYYATFNFSHDNFTLVQSTDLGVFYGQGKFRLDKNILTLTFDTLNLDKSKLKKVLIIKPKVDSLALKIIDKKGFIIEYPSAKGYQERYKKRR